MSTRRVARRGDVHRVAVAGVLAAGLLCGVSGAAQAQTIGLATMQPGTLNHTTGSAIAKVLKEKAGLHALVQPTAGESVIIPLVARQEAELGIANALEVTAVTETTPLPELRLIGVIHPLPTALLSARARPSARSPMSKAARWCSGFRRNARLTGYCVPFWRRAG